MGRAMDAFRSGMLLAFGLLASGLPALAQSPPPAPAPPPVIIVPALPATAPPDDPEALPFPPPGWRINPAPPNAAGATHDGDHLPPIQPLDPHALPTVVVPPPAQKSVKKGVNFWSPEQEIAMGKQIDGQMLSQVQLLDDPVVTAYLDDLTARIARSSDVEVPVVLRVVSSSQPDSFSLPGGYVYITVGMVRETRSEAELAAILSHEVAHIACRHATKQMTKRQLLSMIAVPLMFVGGPIGFALGEGFSLAYPLTLLKFSRNAESEADAVGLRYMEAAGYDPAASVSLFERLASADSSRMPGLKRLFSTHPITSDRLAAAAKSIEKMPARDEYVVDTSRYEEAITRLSRLGFNSDPAKPALIRRTGDAGSAP